MTLTAGSFIGNHEWQIGRDLSGGKPIEYPVGQFQFEAFDQIGNLSEMVRDLQILIDHFDTTVRKNTEQRIRDEANKKRVNVEELLAQRGGGRLKTVAVMRFIRE